MPLHDLLQQIEQNVGSFSSYETISGHGQTIPFSQKPAQQFLRGLGVADVVSNLSTTADGQPLTAEGNPDVLVKSFIAEGASKELVVTGARIDRLLNSAKVYINSDLFPTGYYNTVIESHSIIPQDAGLSSHTNIHWQNMAVGVCHAQEIDLLTESVIRDDGKAVNAPKSGVIAVDAPALLLLSSPALNFSYGQAKHLSQQQQIDFIAGMYRNLFNAALREGRQYIAMPAAGLGVFGGNPEVYFSILMQVAQEYPQLNIIYHPAQYGKQFEAQLEKFKPDNVVRATKDVILIANELTQQGYPCAFHNPSDSDVVYGVYDVGEYWKAGRGAGYVGEEHIGSMTTAPLNSRGLNPNAYINTIEQSLQPEDHPIIVPQEESHITALQQYGFYQSQPQSVDVNNLYGQDIIKQIIFDATQTASEGAWKYIALQPVPIEVGVSRKTQNPALATAEYQIDLLKNGDLKVWQKKQNSAATEITDPSESIKVINHVLANLPKKLVLETQTKRIMGQLVQKANFKGGQLDELCASIEEKTSLSASTWRVKQEGIFHRNWAFVNNNYVIRPEPDGTITVKNRFLMNLTGKDAVDALESLCRSFPELEKSLQTAPEEKMSKVLGS